MKAIAAYLRVSTTGQNLDGQRRDVERWLAGNGIDPQSVLWFIDKASGTNLDRPAFEQLQQAIFHGEVGTVVVWRLDRLSRSMKDGINLLADWCQKGLRIVAITQQIDFSGSLGKMLATILWGVSEMEMEARRERQQAGIAAAKERGVYQGRKAGSTKSQPDRARQLAAKGLTHGEIATALGVSRRTVLRYVRG